MIPIISLAVNWFAKNYRIVAVSFICFLIAAIFVLRHLLQIKDKEIDRITNNAKAYELLAFEKDKNSRVLLLTIEELNLSKDSLLLLVTKLKKQHKVKDKNLVYALVINTEIKDSVNTIIKYKTVDFKEELKLNPLTTIIVSRRDSILTANIDIRNQQTLMVTEKKEYKNSYRNWLVRFLHFDFKRNKTKHYQIINSNPIIKVTDTRVIEVSK